MSTYHSKHGLHIISYKKTIESVIQRAINEHPRSLALRIDLHYPKVQDSGDTVSFFSNLEPGVMARFINSLKSKMIADMQRKQKENKRIHNSTLRYVWVREFSQTDKCHFHVLLLINKDAYYHLGDYDLTNNTLRTMITTAWYSALNMKADDCQALVHYPVNGKYILNKNDANFTYNYEELLTRVDYLTKERTKVFGDGYRSFGCSNS